MAISALRRKGFIFKISNVYKYINLRVDEGADMAESNIQEKPQTYFISILSLFQLYLFF